MIYLLDSVIAFMENFTISTNIYCTFNMIKFETFNESCYVLEVSSDRTISEM